jgi:hypothetical protein
MRTSRVTNVRFLSHKMKIAFHVHPLSRTRERPAKSRSAKFSLASTSISNGSNKNEYIPSKTCCLSAGGLENAECSPTPALPRWERELEWRGSGFSPSPTGGGIRVGEHSVDVPVFDLLTIDPERFIRECAALIAPSLSRGGLGWGWVKCWPLTHPPPNLPLEGGGT